MSNDDTRLTRRRVGAIAAATASWIAGTFAVRREMLAAGGHDPDSVAVARLVERFSDRVELERAALAELAIDAGIAADDLAALLEAFERQIARIFMGETRVSLLDVADGGASVARH
jgi:hypothetical protein